MLFHDNPAEVSALAAQLLAMLAAIRPSPCVQALPIFWWKSGNSSRNFIGGMNAGDDVNRELWTALLGLPMVKDLKVTHVNRAGKLVSIGTVLNYASSGDVVVGTGAQLTNPAVLVNLTITLVRGQRTRMQLADAGIHTHPVVSDSALYAQALVYGWADLRPAPVWPLCVVPHAKDRAFAAAAAADGMHVVVITRPPEEVVRDLQRCRAVASSSLHGLVFADAFGVPSIAYRHPSAREQPKLQDYFLALPDAPSGSCEWSAVQWRTHVLTANYLGTREYQACCGAFGSKAHGNACGGDIHHQPCNVSLLTLRGAALAAARGELLPRVTFFQRATMARAFVTCSVMRSRGSAGCGGKTASPWAARL